MPVVTVKVGAEEYGFDLDAWIARMSEKIEQYGKHYIEQGKPCRRCNSDIGCGFDELRTNVRNAKAEATVAMDAEIPAGTMVWAWDNDPRYRHRGSYVGFDYDIGEHKVAGEFGPETYPHVRPGSRQNEIELDGKLAWDVIDPPLGASGNG